MTEEIEDIFASLAGNSDHDPFTLPVKGVTVRLDAHQRAEISALCAATDMTRQQLLETFVNSGLTAASKAFLSNSDPQVEAEFTHHVHEFLLSEGVHPHVADQVSGVQMDAFDQHQGDDQ